MHRPPPQPTPPTLDDRRFEQEENAALVTRLGTIIGGGAIAGVLGSIPAAIRIGDGGSVARGVHQWIALAALLVPIAIVITLVFRRARVGLRILADQAMGVAAAAVLWWAVLELGILSVFGAVLRAKTHHHALAGVSFALFALISGLFVAMLALRGARMISATSVEAQRLALGVAAFAALLAVMLAAVRTARSSELHTASALVDVLSTCVAAALASTRPFARAKALAITGVPLALGIVALGFSMIHSEPSLRDDIVTNAPMHTAILSFLVTR